MKRMKRAVVLVLALILCLGLTATAFAALPEDPDTIRDRVSVTSSLNSMGDTWVEEELKMFEYSYPRTGKKDALTYTITSRWVINDDTTLTVANLSPADCSDVIFVDVLAFSKDTDGSYASVENDASGNPVYRFVYTANGWKTVAPSYNFNSEKTFPGYYAIPAASFIMITGAELRNLIRADVENPIFCILTHYASSNGHGRYDTHTTIWTFEANNMLAAELKGGEYEKPDDSGNPFTDVPTNAFFHDAVLWALDKNVTTGTSKTTFSPSATCTRGQVVTFLWRAMGCPEPASTENPFTDVAESDYFYKAVLWAVEKGVTNGTTDTTFGPNGTCTSAHVVTFLWRANGKPAANAEGTNYYDEAVAWANSQKLLDGTAVPFAPDNLSPRADIVTYLYRVLGK